MASQVCQQCKHRINRHSVLRAAFYSDKHYSCHLNNFLSSKSTDESIHRCQVAPGRERQVFHSSFIQLFQLCSHIQIFHHVKQSICIRLYWKNHTKKSVETMPLTSLKKTYHGFYIYIHMVQHWLCFSVNHTDLRAKQREAMLFLHKAVKGLESQVQGLVLCSFPKIAYCDVLMVQQGFTQWFLQIMLLLTQLNLPFFIPNTDEDTSPLSASRSGAPHHYQSFTV